ncbi:hypothetical protein SeMB42_g00950 [Synchytrium endobioticum]|uniref:AMMECR1 domain-containing protein n=1 Tax=Synchytrium endobioticum TaxID=286115 RepID=A0A507DC58_9FUNG|nr:hypothetical protein SeLEV6574_g01752 [Synchytrium endobioticum]TPX53174.1 hypothetical protein SeMB42_g00950 [Synchytrium endobioticum]
MTSLIRKRSVYGPNQTSDQDVEDLAMWAEPTGSESGERRRKDSGFYADCDAGNSGTGLRPQDTTKLYYEDDDEISSGGDPYFSDSGDEELLRNDNVSLPPPMNASKTAGFTQTIPSPPPSPSLPPQRVSGHRKLKSLHIPEPQLHSQLPPFAKKTPRLPSPTTDALPPTEERKPLAREIAFLILFTCISCVSCMTIPPSSIWIRFLHSLGGLYLSLPTVITLALVWGSMLNSIREYIGVIVSTREFITIAILLSQTYFAVRGIPYMFLFFDELRQTDPMGVGILSVWSVLSSSTAAVFMLGRDSSRLVGGREDERGHCAINKQPSKQEAPMVATAWHCVYCFDVLISHLDNQRDTSASAPEARFDNDKYPLFVSWHVATNGRLRGCIGNFEPLYLHGGLKEYALTSALKDRRFNPISTKEISNLSCGVSLLTDFEDGDDYLDWKIGTHGVWIEFRDQDDHKRTATYLPEVALEQGWTKIEAIDSLLRKGGFTGRITENIRRKIILTRYQSSKHSITYDDYQRLKTFGSSTQIAN